MTGDLERIRKTLDSLTPTLVSDLVRRSRYTPTPPRPEGKGASGTHSDPTLASVVRSMSGGNLSDPIGDSVREIAHALNDAAKLMEKIEQRVAFIYNTEDKAKRPSTARCEACDREVMCTPNDRVRSGYCQSCYRMWNKLGRPYRLGFETSIRNGEKPQ
jgi:hypothetical protein